MKKLLIIIGVTIGLNTSIVAGPMAQFILARGTGFFMPFTVLQAHSPIQLGQCLVKTPRGSAD